MNLTRKCKEDFNKWFINNFATHHFGQWNRTDINHFYSLPDSFKWGALVDFFDSKGYEVVVYKDNKTWEIDVNNDWQQTNIKTRKEAREIAIKILSQFYNFDAQDA